METLMDRTALAAALSAGLLAPSGVWGEDQEPSDRGDICGDSASTNAVQSPPSEVEGRRRSAA